MPEIVIELGFPNNALNCSVVAEGPLELFVQSWQHDLLII